MSHNSGIPASEELIQSFGRARTEGGIRFLKVEIVDDQLVQTGSSPLGASIEEDFAKLPQFFEGKIPCYIVFRLDSKNDNGYQWMLMSYVPDGSLVRQRMLYGSTRELTKRHLGSTYFASDMHGSAPDDFSYAMFLQLKSKTVDAPLTEAEIVHKSESSMEIDHGHTREYVHSVSFPLSAAAIDALRSLPSASNNLVQLVIDQERETVELHANKAVAVNAFSNAIPTDHPCFNFYRYDHTHPYESTQEKSIVFIYSCPDNSKVKARMLYSTVKAAATGAAESLGVTIVKKLEVSDPSDVSENYLSEELHPPPKKAEAAFSRPARAGRGRPRMTGK